MKRSRLTRWLIVAMMAWLPISGALASAMPLSVVLSPVAMAQMADADSGAAEDAIMPCHQVMPDGVSACSHCHLCQIAGAMLPPTPAVLAATARHDCPQSIGAVAFVSFIPPLLQRPPAFSHA